MSWNHRTRSAASSTSCTYAAFGEALGSRRRWGRCQARGRAVRHRRAAPDLGAHLGRDRADHAVKRRVRGDVAEQLGAGPEMVDVSTALATARDGQRHLDKHLATVMSRGALGAHRDPGRERFGEGEAVGKAPRACSPTWATTPLPPASTLTRAVLVASICEMPRALSRLCAAQITERHERSGLRQSHSTTRPARLTDASRNRSRECCGECAGDSRAPKGPLRGHWRRGGFAQTGMGRHHARLRADMARVDKPAPPSPHAGRFR